MLIRLAARNLRRNLRRTVLTLAAIAVGFALACVSVNLSTGSYIDMIDAGISQQAGHVVVQALGYQRDKDDAQRVSGASEIAARLQGIDPAAKVSRRVLLQGLLVAPTGSVGAGVMGVDPGVEQDLSLVAEHIVEGQWLDPTDTRGILVGRAMADRLGVGLGDKLVYMGQHGGDEVTSRLFRVKGIYRTGGAELDGFFAVVHVDAGSEVLGAPDTVHQVALHLSDPDRTFEAAAAARSWLGPEVEVLDWQRALPELGAMIEVDRQSNEFIINAILLIVAMGVVNTVLMSVLERTREFGVLMAIGMRPARLAVLVLLEGLVLGLLGSALGLALGLLLSWPLVTTGIDYSAFMGAETMETGGVVLAAVVKAAWDWPRMLKFAVLSVVWTVLAAAWPAWRTSRFQPVDAMRSA